MASFRVVVDIVADDAEQAMIDINAMSQASENKSVLIQAIEERVS